MPPAKSIDEVIANMEALQLEEGDPIYTIYQELVAARKADIQKRIEEEEEAKKNLEKEEEAKKKLEKEISRIQEENGEKESERLENERMEREEQRKKEEAARVKEELQLQAKEILAARGGALPNTIAEPTIPAPSASPARISQAPITSAPRPPNPAFFDGSDTSALNSFLLASENYFSAYQAYYPTARSQIMWAAGFLRGALGERVSTALLEDSSQPWLESWGSFTKYLITNYGQPRGERIASAAQTLQSAKQGTRTGREHLSSLYGAIDLLQPISLSVLISMVKSGLNSGLRDRLLKPAEYYSSYEDFCEDVRTQDSLWRSEGGHLRHRIGFVSLNGMGADPR